MNQYDWKELKDCTPPEGVLLAGQDDDGSIYPFLYRELNEQVKLFIDVNLSALPTPIRWSYFKQHNQSQLQ